MNNPKEFWIDPTLIDDEEDTSVFDAFKNKPTQGPLQWQASLIHVIEYSAHEQLQAKFNEAVEVIKIIDLNFKKITKCPDNYCDGCHEDAKIAAEYSSKFLRSLDKGK